MGGAMLRDFCIVATAFEVQVDEAQQGRMARRRRAVAGHRAALHRRRRRRLAFGYTDAVSMTTIGAGAVTYIVGPVTGAAIGASSDVMALSIATGVVKAIMVMVGTPFAGRVPGAEQRRARRWSSAAWPARSAASAPGWRPPTASLVPYGALVATFHTGLGCLMGPSVLFLAVKALIG